MLYVFLVLVGLLLVYEITWALKRFFLSLIYYFSSAFDRLLRIALPPFCLLNLSLLLPHLSHRSPLSFLFHPGAQTTASWDAPW